LPGHEKFHDNSVCSGLVDVEVSQGTNIASSLKTMSQLQFW